MATVGLYSSNAAQPRSCISAAACTGFDLEVTPANCTNEVRWPISAERYFWDVYDTANDGETLAQGVWHLTDTLHAFDPGTDNRQRDETWNGSFSSLDDLEGHSTLDFMENWKTWGTDS